MQVAQLPSQVSTSTQPLQGGLPTGVALPSAELLTALNLSNSPYLLRPTSAQLGGGGLLPLLSSLLATGSLSEASRVLKASLPALIQPQAAQGVPERSVLGNQLLREEIMLNPLIDTPLPLSALESAPLDRILQGMIAVEAVSLPNSQGSSSLSTAASELLGIGVQQPQNSDPRTLQQTPQSQNLNHGTTSTSPAQAQPSPRFNSASERLRYQEHHYRDSSPKQTSSLKLLRTLISGLETLFRRRT